MSEFGGFGGGGEWGAGAPQTGKPPAHYRLTYSGVLGPDAAPWEIWSMSLALGFGDGLTTTAEGQTFLGAAESNFRSSLATQMNANVKCTRIRLAQIGSDGRTARRADGAYSHVDRAPSTPLRGQATGTVPPQIALALTLQSAAPGVTGRGRIFLPQPNMTTYSDVTGGLTQVGATNFADHLVNLLVALNTAAGVAGMGPVVVASGGSAAQGIAPANRPVTSVSVGRVLDTIRSRRNALPESRVKVNLP